jgi:CRP-like cAMP-binding protein
MADVATKINEHFSKYPKRSYPRGQILVFAGENPQHIFYITKGRVRKYDVSYRGDEVIVNLFKPPAFFPMTWAINNTDNNYFYKAEVDSEVHLVPREDALAFLEANPDVMLDLLSRLYRGMDGLLGRVVHLMSGTARSRLLYELIIECRRFGEKQSDGSYVLKSNEGDLAARSGLSRETVSREIKKVKEQGLIQLSNKEIHITDLGALEKKLGKAL